MTAEQTAERASRVKKGERGRKEPLHLSGGNGRKEGRKEGTEDQGRSVVTVIQIREIEGERGRLHCTALLPCHAPAAPPIPLPPLALPPSLPALLGRIANFTSGCMHDFGAGRACVIHAIHAPEMYTASGASYIQIKSVCTRFREGFFYLLGVELYLLLKRRQGSIERSSRNRTVQFPGLGLD